MRHARGRKRPAAQNAVERTMLTGRSAKVARENDWSRGRSAKWPRENDWERRMASRERLGARNGPERTIGSAEWPRENSQRSLSTGFCAPEESLDGVLRSGGVSRRGFALRCRQREFTRRLFAPRVSRRGFALRSRHGQFSRQGFALRSHRNIRKHRRTTLGRRSHAKWPRAPAQRPPCAPSRARRR